MDEAQQGKNEGVSTGIRLEERREDQATKARVLSGEQKKDPRSEQDLERREPDQKRPGQYESRVACL